MKTCRRCKDELEKSAFPKNKNKKDGLSLYCKGCCSKNTMECRNRVKEVNPETGKTIYKKKHSLYIVGSPEYSKHMNLKKAYGITLDEYNELCVIQNNKCAICKKETTKTLSVDHCHTTGKIRGLLCNKCNLGIGHFEDDIENLKNAITYLT